MAPMIDLVIRSACIGVCLLMIVHFISIRPVSRKSISAIDFILAAIAMTVTSSMISVELMQTSQTLQTVKTLVFAFAPILVAWGILEIFEDDFEVQPWQIAFVCFSIPTHFMTGIHPAFGYICHFTSMGIYAYIFYVAWSTSKNDLVAARCQFRLWFMSGAALAGIVFSLLHLVYGDYELPTIVRILEGATILVLSIIFAYWALKVREHVWAMPNREKRSAPENLSPAEMGLLKKLEASMEDDIWRQEGLTIRKLAEILESPEHRLRKVINQGLGYRNFAHFVNEHRIGAACEVLADPIKAEVPIITIAYEVGYASLGPFNRAFRDIVGESPTEFRKRIFSPV